MPRKSLWAVALVIWVTAMFLGWWLVALVWGLIALVALTPGNRLATDLDHDIADRRAEREASWPAYDKRVRLRSPADDPVQRYADPDDLPPYEPDNVRY